VTKWLQDLKEADRVALMILYTGIGLSVFAALLYLGVIFHPSITEAAEDRALDVTKDLGAVGGSLISAAILALKLQDKKPPEPPKP
jgi:hypothetical protein